MISFNLDGKEFYSKRSVQDAVQAVLNPQVYGHAFEFNLLADLVHRYHYYCSKHNLRPQQFRKLRRARGGYELQGFFGSLGWHGVSYLKCLTPPTFESEFKKALRAAVEHLTWSRRTHMVCEKCGCPDRLEQHHVKPTFNEVYTECLKVVNSVEHAAWENFDWSKEPDFKLPPESESVKKALEMHRDAVIQTLCAGCHRGVR